MTDSGPPIVAKNLHKSYEGFVAVEDSSFSVSKGEVLGIVGPNGAGKTTTLKMISGLIEPTTGDVVVSGIPAGSPSMRQDLGFLPEESPLYENMTAQSYLRFFADLYNVPRSTADDRINDILDKLDLEHRTDRKIGDMSKGMTRKVAIARALVNDPTVLVFDEPASGLDPLTTNYVIEFTKSLSDEGKTIVFSAHNLHHVEEVCDRVLIMDNGEIVAHGTIEHIRDEYGETSFEVVSSIDFDEGEPVSNGYKYFFDSLEEVDTFRAQVQHEGGEIVSLRTREDSLEEIFLNIIGRVVIE